MQSFNYNIKFMTPQQLNKDLVFNEAILKLDGFCSHAIKGFVDAVPQEFVIGDKYIINQGQMKNNICYIFSQSSGWQFLSPKEGMVFFCSELGQMILFDGQEWQKIQSLNAEQQAMPQAALSEDKFISIAGDFLPDPWASNLCLYMSQDATLDISKMKSSRLTLIIKQNYQETFELSWQGQILWKDKSPHQITQKTNHFDVLEFYKICQTNHFIAKIIGTAYQY